jgi:glyoxylase-like metal-dependent hydrolase (beta-lactamase superfamily II)
VVIAPPEVICSTMASLRRLLALDLSVIVPAHGPEIGDPRALLDSIWHRRAGRQVLDGLATGPATIPMLVARILTWTTTPSRRHALRRGAL